MKRYRLKKPTAGLQNIKYIEETMESDVYKCYDGVHENYLFTLLLPPIQTDDADFFEELPHPPAKETYTIAITHMHKEPGLYKDSTDYEQELDLAPDAAVALSKAIEALVAYVQKPNFDLHSGSHVVEMIESAAKAIQDGSAA